jgi:hypothetical protein
MMNAEIFSNIANILERDSKSTTYKFALLRGVIEIAQENSPYIQEEGNKVFIPMGLLVYKFILYYYPLFLSELSVPQIGGNSKLAFQDELNDLIRVYQLRGGISALNKDIRGGGVDSEAAGVFLRLGRKIASTIRNMPMKHIGYSVNDTHYSIFQPEVPGRLHRSEFLDLKYLIEHMGSFSVPIEYYEVFKVLGSFISGRDSILLKWADFSVKASKKVLPIEAVLSQMLNEPVDERYVLQAKQFYQELMQTQGHLNCVWSGKQVTKYYHVDHVIPYSVWANNDLWNLLPAQGAINGKKRDKIPSPGLIASQRDLIVACWEGMNLRYENRFMTELQVSLLGNEPTDYWQDRAIEQLQASCGYLIHQRGFQSWEG